MSSINVSDTTMPGTAPISYVADGLRKGEIPLAYGFCSNGTGAWAQYADLAGGTGEFHVGLTPTWSTPSDGTCEATLEAFNPATGKRRNLAHTTFKVTGQVDRTYWHVPGARSWHAEAGTGLTFRGLCGREVWSVRASEMHRADRLPPAAHLCGNCARIIAARTDVEEDTTYGVTVAPI